MPNMAQVLGIASGSHLHLSGSGFTSKCVLFAGSQGTAGRNSRLTAPWRAGTAAAVGLAAPLARQGLSSLHQPPGRLRRIGAASRSCCLVPLQCTAEQWRWCRLLTVTGADGKPKVLGSGAFGIVYQARLDDYEEVAVKVNTLLLVTFSVTPG